MDAHLKSAVLWRQMFNPASPLGSISCNLTSRRENSLKKPFCRGWSQNAAGQAFALQDCPGYSWHPSWSPWPPARSDLCPQSQFTPWALRDALQKTPSKILNGRSPDLGRKAVGRKLTASKSPEFHCWGHLSNYHPKSLEGTIAQILRPGQNKQCCVGFCLMFSSTPQGKSPVTTASHHQADIWIVSGDLEQHGDLEHGAQPIHSDPWASYDVYFQQKPLQLSRVEADISNK